jgi:phosphoribosylformimino-5-aminoimidazole carboxamide ribotide isomerase
MIIYPAIDLKNGQCVRLVQGRKEDQTVYSSSPGKVAASFQEQGARWLHIVDLDGAFDGRPGNLEAIRDIAAAITIPFQVGGGLRSKEDVERILAIGAGRVIIGTRAVSSPDFIAELIKNFGAERVVLGLDARDGMVAVEGWVEKSNLKALDFALTMKEAGIKNRGLHGRIPRRPVAGPQSAGYRNHGPLQRPVNNCLRRSVNP